MLGALLIGLVVFLVATFPATWLLMLFLGNVGVGTSYWGTLPLGVVVSIAAGRRVEQREGVTMIAGAIASWLYWTLAIIIWIAIAFWPARVAARKGHSFLGFFLFSLIFFPAALIVAYVVKPHAAVA